MKIVKTWKRYTILGIIFYFLLIGIVTMLHVVLYVPYDLLVLIQGGILFIGAVGWIVLTFLPGIIQECFITQNINLETLSKEDLTQLLDFIDHSKAEVQKEWEKTHHGDT